MKSNSTTDNTRPTFLLASFRSILYFHQKRVLSHTLLHSSLIPPTEIYRLVGFPLVPFEYRKIVVKHIPNSMSCFECYVFAHHADDVVHLLHTRAKEWKWVLLSHRKSEVAFLYVRQPISLHISSLCYTNTFNDFPIYLYIKLNVKV